MIYAGFWRRLAAFIIDWFLCSIVVGVIPGILLGLKLRQSGWKVDLPIFLTLAIFQVIILWLYWAAMESSSKQATVGKKALGIVVTDLEGNRISFGRATGRYWARFISFFILFIGILMIGFTAKKQGLHDILSKCLVVIKK